MPGQREYSIQVEQACVMTKRMGGDRREYSDSVLVDEDNKTAITAEEKVEMQVKSYVSVNSS